MPAMREQRIGVVCAMPAKCEVWLKLAECASPVGPHISLLPSLVLSGLHARMTFRERPQPANGPRGEVTLTTPLVPFGERVARPSQFLRGVLARSALTIRLFDHERTPLSEEREIGECADGVLEVIVPLVAPVSIVAWVMMRDCPERMGPRLRVDGELVFGRGITLRLGSRPLERPAGRMRESSTDVPLVHPGTALHFPEKTIEGGFPGSTFVSLTFVDAGDQPFGSETPIEMTRLG